MVILLGGLTLPRPRKPRSIDSTFHPTFHFMFDDVQCRGGQTTRHLLNISANIVVQHFLRGWVGKYSSSELSVAVLRGCGDVTPTRIIDRRAAQQTRGFQLPTRHTQNKRICIDISIMVSLM